MRIRRLNENFSRFEDEGFFDWEGFEKFVNRYIKSKDDDITISTRFYRDNYSTKVQVTNGEDTRSYYLIYDKDKNVLTEYIDKSYSEEEGKNFSSEKEYADHLLDEFGYAAVYGRLKDGHPEWDSGIDNFIEIAKYARRNPADWDDFMRDFLKVFNTYNYKDDRLEWLSAEIYPSKRHGTFEAELHAYTRHPRERTMSYGEYVYDIQWDGKNNEWVALGSRYESVKQLARDIYKDLEKNGWLNRYDESIKRTKSNFPLKEKWIDTDDGFYGVEDDEVIFCDDCGKRMKKNYKGLYYCPDCEEKRTKENEYKFITGSRKSNFPLKENYYGWFKHHRHLGSNHNEVDWDIFERIVNQVLGKLSNKDVNIKVVSTRSDRNVATINIYDANSEQPVDSFEAIYWAGDDMISFRGIEARARELYITSPEEAAKQILFWYNEAVRVYRLWAGFTESGVDGDVESKTSRNFK